MSNFITNLFPSSQGSKQDSSTLPTAPPPLLTRSSQNDALGARPSTPTMNSFITPASTPQGSPSKSRFPPGANDLPTAFENAMKLNPPNFSPTKSGRGTPLSPGKSNALVAEDLYFKTSTSNIEDSVLHKSTVPPSSPLRKQGQENTPPSSRQGQEATPQNQAAISRQELYQPREQPVKKYNTQRGLTAEELEILQKPNVKRLANVTQLCKNN
jgi:cell cycle protein kinase DBF2